MSCVGNLQQTSTLVKAARKHRKHFTQCLVECFYRVLPRFLEGIPWIPTLLAAQCYCGMPSDTYSRLGEGLCNETCDGDSSQICGGMLAFSAFEYFTPLPTPTEGDEVNGRGMCWHSDHQGFGAHVPIITPEAFSLGLL